MPDMEAAVETFRHTPICGFFRARVLVAEQEVGTISRPESPIIRTRGGAIGAGLDAELADDTAAVIDSKPLGSAPIAIDADCTGRAYSGAFGATFRAKLRREARHAEQALLAVASTPGPRGRRASFQQSKKSPKRHLFEAL